VGAFPALVNVHLICAAGRILAAGMAINKPVSVPKLPGLPVTAEFASLQLAPAIVKNALLLSETCTMEFKVLTAMAEGAAGAAEPIVDVVMAAGVAARFDTAKLNGPPSPPVVIFCTATVAGFAMLVSVQLICAAGKTFAAGTVKTFPARLPKLAGLPVKLEFASEHVADAALKLALAASVICTCVFAVVT
jgi:hypothetical protein